MKKRAILVGILIGLWVSVQILVLPSNSLAEESPTQSTKIGDNLYLNIGLKTWLASWQTTILSAPSISGAHVNALTSDPTTVLIPSLSLRYKNVFVSGGYFASTNFKFPTSSELASLSPPSGIVLATQTVSVKRDEMDLNLGYSITSNFAVSIGYKTVRQRYHTTETIEGLPDATADDTTRISGPTIGASGTAPIGGGFNLYGNISYGLITEKTTEMSEKGDYVSSELGIAYRFHSLTISGGYKYQIISASTGDNIPGFPKQSTLDVTRGAIL